MGENTAFRRLLFWHVASVLLTLYEYEQQGYTPTVSELINKTGISPSLFHTSLKNKFVAARLIELQHNPDRTVTVRLTEKGRRLAECLWRCRDVLPL